MTRATAPATARTAWPGTMDDPARTSAGTAASAGNTEEHRP
ncbi:hypothetical protein ACFW9D_33335 [Streptomyces sp. NPDC059524]